MSNGIEFTLTEFYETLILEGIIINFTLQTFWWSGLRKTFRLLPIPDKTLFLNLKYIILLTLFSWKFVDDIQFGKYIKIEWLRTMSEHVTHNVYSFTWTSLYKTFQCIYHQCFSDQTPVFATRVKRTNWWGRLLDFTIPNGFRCIVLIYSILLCGLSRVPNQSPVS